MAGIEKRTIAAAGFDVYCRDPAIHPGLTQLENAVLLPHMGSAAVETRTAMGRRVLADLEAIDAGRRPFDLISARVPTAGEQPRS